MIVSCPQADIYVLPEMWSTGFIANNHELAEAEENSLKNGSIAWMTKKAAEKNAAVCGSLAIKTLQGKFVNRMYFAKPDGTIEHYDKRHLFSPGGKIESSNLEKSARLWNFEEQEYFFRYAMTLDFLYGADAKATMMLQYMLPTGQQADTTCGKHYSRQEPSRTNATLSV